MKRHHLILLCTLAITINSFAGDGIRPVYANRSLWLMPDNFSYFIGGLRPDSAVLVLKQPKSFQKSDDSLTGLFTITGSTIKSYKKSATEFFRDANLQRLLFDKLKELNEVAFFRLYFKNDRNEIFRYQDISVQKKLVAEMTLTDAASISLELQKYYGSASVLSRCQLRVGKLDSIEKKTRDSLWFDLNPKLVKNGKEDIYYDNQTLRLSRRFIEGILVDTIYTEYYYDGVPKRKFRISRGLLDGDCLLFDRKGEVAATQVYEKGRFVRLSGKNPVSSNKKAFLYGLNNYDIKRPGSFETRLPFPNLDGCVNDIMMLQSALVNTCGFDKDNIMFVSDSNGSRKKVLLAFDRFVQTLKRGDVVFLHFSGHGNITGKLADTLHQYEGLYLPCADYNYPSDTAFSRSNCVFQFELERFLNNIKSKLGSTGQLIVSLDASHSGELLGYAKSDTLDRNTEVNARGESNNLLFNLLKDETSPVIIYTGTSSSELGFELEGDNGEVLGAYSYALAKSLPSALNSAELYENISSIIKAKVGKQTPGYLATETQFLFEGKEVAQMQRGKTLPELHPQGHVYLLSVGISDYPKNKSKLQFNNCVADARSYSDFFSGQFNAINSGINQVNSYLLLDKNATKDKILDAINQAISNSKPDDYFIFNFSGYCRPLKDSGGKQVTFFVPYGLSDINDTTEIKAKGLPLNQLKDLFQMIPANNQLFITEAGSTDDFQKEFIQSLIESSPSIAALSNKNRVFIVPKASGLDNFMCRNLPEQHGPINYCITNLSSDLNVFGLFEGGIYADALTYAFNKTEINCDYFRTGYFDIFFEREFVKSLKYLLPDELMKSRGGKAIATEQAKVAGSIGKRYALVIGTSVYGGKPDWSDLDGVPSLDATDIAGALKKDFGYEVSILIDKPSDSIYENILQLSRILKENDQLIIYVAGHGDYDDRLFDDGFIVCANSKPVKQDPYRNSYIQYSKLSRMINKLPSKQIWMVLDVCFGGTFDERVARNKSRAKTDDYADLSAQEYLTDKLKLKTRLYLTSGGKKEVPNGYKGSHSPFAQRFLQCLQTKGGTGKILTASDFYQFVKMLPSGPLLGSFGDDDYGSEFIMLAK